MDPAPAVEDEHLALILVVEDNEMNADMLSRRLQRAGHEVLLATDGQAGVELTRQHRPELVLMDMCLLVMDGWTATRAIKADASIAHIPVLAGDAAELNQPQRVGRGDLQSVVHLPRGARLCECGHAGCEKERGHQPEEQEPTVH